MSLNPTLPNLSLCGGGTKVLFSRFIENRILIVKFGIFQEIQDFDLKSRDFGTQPSNRDSLRTTTSCGSCPIHSLLLLISHDTLTQTVRVQFEMYDATITLFFCFEFRIWYDDRKEMLVTRSGCYFDFCHHSGPKILTFVAVVDPKL